MNDARPVEGRKSLTPASPCVLFSFMATPTDIPAQHERMLGQSKRNVPNRPELIEKYGWDVKYGSHALRLAYQGFEIASTGVLSLPLPDRERERVLAVKRGEVDRDEVSSEIARLEDAVRMLLDEDRSPLPETADLDRISAWAIHAQRRHWSWV